MLLQSSRQVPSVLQQSTKHSVYGRKNVWQIILSKLCTGNYCMRTVLMSAVEFFGNNILMLGECHISNIHSWDFWWLFCSLSKTHAWCLFSEWGCPWVMSWCLWIIPFTLVNNQRYASKEPSCPWPAGRSHSTSQSTNTMGTRKGKMLPSSKGRAGLAGFPSLLKLWDIT